jgi:two-component system cell cycle sensor histidine kinase/response regulator CckA
VEKSRERKGEIVAVVFHLTMPHMNGEEAFREMRRPNPGVQVFPRSGYAENDISSRLAGRGRPICSSAYFARKMSPR